MSFDIAVTREAQHVRVAIRGQATHGQLLSLMQVLQVDSRNWNTDEVLFDFTGLATSFAPVEQSQVQAEAARWLPQIRSITIRWGPA